MAILDNDGNRILAKYYDDNIFPTIKEQKAFEKNLFNRTHRANAEIIMLDGITCLYRSNVDLFFYVMGSSHENEVSTLLYGVYYVNCIFYYFYHSVVIDERLTMHVRFNQSNFKEKCGKTSCTGQLRCCYVGVG